MHEEACKRSSFSAAGWTTVSQWRKSACLCKHQHLCVGAKLWHGHQPWTYRGHQWQLPGCKETVQASALEEHMYFPSHKKTVLCALLGGFSHKRPRFNAYGKCSSGWQMSQWRVLAFSASVQWKGPLPSPVFIPPQTACLFHIVVFRNDAPQCKVHTRRLQTMHCSLPLSSPSPWRTGEENWRHQR